MYTIDECRGSQTTRFPKKVGCRQFPQYVAFLPAATAENRRPKNGFDELKRTVGPTSVISKETQSGGAGSRLKSMMRQGEAGWLNRRDHQNRRRGGGRRKRRLEWTFGACMAE